MSLPDYQLQDDKAYPARSQKMSIRIRVPKDMKPEALFFWGGGADVYPWLLGVVHYLYVISLWCVGAGAVGQILSVLDSTSGRNIDMGRSEDPGLATTRIRGSVTQIFKIN